MNEQDELAQLRAQLASEVERRMQAEAELARYTGGPGQHVHIWYPNGAPSSRWVTNAAGVVLTCGCSTQGGCDCPATE